VLHRVSISLWILARSWISEQSKLNGATWLLTEGLEADHCQSHKLFGHYSLKQLGYNVQVQDWLIRLRRWICVHIIGEM